MPLPESGNTSWPPKHLTPVLRDMHTWDVWWSGDTDRLADLYGGMTTGGRDPKPVQFSSGFIGRLARWFWGAPTPAGEQRTKIHVPIAGDICAMSSRLLFAEAPTARVTDQKTQQRLDTLLDDGMHAALLDAGEVAAALGGVYLRTVYDKDIADRPWIDAVHPDAAVPEWKWGRLFAVTFWRVVGRKDGHVWRHLERHESGDPSGHILHGLYQGTGDSLGTPVPLEDSEATEDLAREVDSEGRIRTGVKGLDVTYLQNRMSRRWRATPYSALGRSDLDGVLPLMDALDETYSAWMRDVRLSKGRIVVPDSMLENRGPGQGARWDPDREVYSAVNALHRPGDSLTLLAQQFAIRAADFLTTSQDLVNQILRSTGYSTQTFGTTGDAAVTATEINARERLSSLSRTEKTLRARPQVARQLQITLIVDAEVFRSGARPELPDIEFADSVVEDPLTLANTVETLRRGQAASTETLVRMLHPDWDERDVIAEADRIMAETGMSVADPTQVGADLPPEAAMTATPALPELAAGE